MSPIRTGVFNAQTMYSGDSPQSLPAFVQSLERDVCNALTALIDEATNDGRRYRTEFLPFVSTPIDGKPHSVSHRMAAKVGLINPLDAEVNEYTFYHPMFGPEFDNHAMGKRIFIKTSIGLWQRVV